MAKINGGVKKIYIGADHAGFELKEKLKNYLKKKYNIIDLGNKKLEVNDDYPVFGRRVALKVAKDKKSLGILICGSGAGVCIAANKIKSIRAAVAEHIKDAFLARKDDDVNVLCLGGRNTKFQSAKKIVDKFLETKFEAVKKRIRRLNEIKKLEDLS
ncbi:RpiB/LacA/LacB family sugar-phosphate isomerase [Candidatus Woesearchaeota archaeon]|nr:RpiB/LacA/LacB family sugar-phosphate isomerase [Candidatus Woesearchaeota archaeon]